MFVILQVPYALTPVRHNVISIHLIRHSWLTTFLVNVVSFRCREPAGEPEPERAFSCFVANSLGVSKPRDLCGL